MSRTGALRRAVGAAVLAAAVSVAGAAPAAAHAGFSGSDPADGASLPVSPDAVTLRFTEAVDPDVSRVELLDAGGNPVDAAGPLERPEPSTVRVPLGSPLSEGVYTVTWHVVSSVDGHLTAGAIAFGVGAPPGEVATVVEPSTPGPSPLGVAGRVALAVGLSLLVALGVVGAWAFRGRLRSAGVVAVVGGVVAVAGALLLVASEVDLVGSSTSRFLASDAGRPFVRLAIATAIAAAVAVAAAARPSRGTMWAAALTAAVAFGFRAATGHPAAGGLVRELGQTVHTVAVASWVGGLVLLLTLLAERRRRPDVDPSAVGAEARRFSSVATVAVPVVVVTGGLRALQEIGGVGALADAIGTGYGRVLAAKVAAAGLLIGLGAASRRRGLRRIDAGEAMTLRRLVAGEVVVALGVFALTGALTSLPPRPADDARDASPPARVVAEGADFATTVRVRLEVSPGTAGPNDVTLSIVDHDAGSPAAADEVSLRLDPLAADLPAASVELRRDGDRWTGRATIPLAGTWRATVRAIAGSGATEVPLVLTTRTLGATATDTEVPGQPTLTTVTYADRTSAQLYVDPGAPGPNQVHLTVFDQAGRELQLRDATLAVVAPDGVARRADVLRFGPGHFVANLDLADGPWTFDFIATTTDGDTLQATMRRSIGATG